jgi:hypothetical protein
MQTTILLALSFLLSVTSLLHPFGSQEKDSQKERKKEVISPLIPLKPGREAEPTTARVLQTQVLGEIQDAISRGEMRILAQYLGPQVYLSLKGSEAGYYSANQALFVLQNYFSVHRPISFSFSTQGEVEDNPFATGRGYLNMRGIRESVQVYVSLVRHNGRWVVSEFNVY